MLLFFIFSNYVIIIWGDDMKKAYSLILMLICIFLLSSCEFESKKRLVARNESNIVEDFDLMGANQPIIQDYIKARCVDNELTNTKSGRWGTLTLSSSKTVTLEEVSFTIYNKTEDKSFYIYEHKGLEGGFGDKKKTYGYPHNDLSELRVKKVNPGEEVNVVIPLNNVKINKKAIIYISYGFASYINETYDGDNINECVENGGLCDLKLK